MKPFTLFTLLALLSNACTAPQKQFNNEELKPALLYAEEENWENVQDLLGDYASADFSIATQPDFNYLMAQAYDKLNKKSLALFHYEELLTLPNASPSQTTEGEQKLLQYSQKLLSGEMKVAGIFTNRARGIKTLENLTVLARTPSIKAEALARSAEYYFQDERYEIASKYYLKLQQPQYESFGWADRATFGFAMCRYKMLVPRKSDLQSLLLAYYSLENYLKQFPAGLNRAIANKTLAACRQTIAQQQLLIGNYYLTIDNMVGAVHHFKLASGQTSNGENTFTSIIDVNDPAAQEAAAQLKRLNVK